jgi:hypothetical protein
MNEAFVGPVCQSRYVGRTRYEVLQWQFTYCTRSVGAATLASRTPRSAVITA